MGNRKIDAMHSRFGVIPDKRCGDCSNLMHICYRSKNLKKCKVYGVTHSEASDWRLKYTACGMFNKECEYGPIIRTLQHGGGSKKEMPPCEGQISLEGL